MHTQTGSFPIGFRRLRSPWQRDLPALIVWAKSHGFSHIDLGPDADIDGPPILDSGLSIGSADLPDWTNLITTDTDRRKRAVEKCIDYIHSCARLGISSFFLVMLPADPSLPGHQNFPLMIESLNELSPTLDQSQCRLVIEGWPGPGALCCTPETIRATFKACTSSNVSLNFDPSHLIRMHIDPLRFLEEFADRIHHIHAKDTIILTENLYDLGIEQPPTWAKPHQFGSCLWRYCVPGCGAFPWTRALTFLAKRNYPGSISIELEDENFNGSEEGEKNGLLAAAQFLASS